LVVDAGLAMLLISPPGAAAAPGSVHPLGKRICKPNCRSKTCGDNGCGGTCGRCAKGSACYKNVCTKAPKGDPCVAMTGGWTGVMPATGSHPAEYLRGRIWGTARSCRARFDVSYLSGGRKVTVIEHFTVTLWGPRARRSARFVCTRISYVTPGVRYSKDTFTGTLNINLTRYSGTVLDTSSSTSPVVLTKQ